MSLKTCFNIHLAPLRSALRARNASAFTALRTPPPTSYSVFSKSPLRVQTAKFSSGTTSNVFAYTKENARYTNTKGGKFYAYAGVAGIGLGVALSTLPSTNQPIHCEASPPPTPAPQALPPPPESTVNFYELSFGTVAGLCAGIFVKKGANIAGFFLGGIFVLLQYFANASLIRVDWTRFASRFENLFYTNAVDARTGETVRKAPSVASLVRWIVDFLTADFQQRASFVAGFALGLRVG